MIPTASIVALVVPPLLLVEIVKGVLPETWVIICPVFRLCATSVTASAANHWEPGKLR